MDPSSSRALSALEPFIALAKTANSPIAASDLITRATSHPQTYVFAELLETRNIQALRNAEDPKHRAYLTLLEIFCWGTWADYEKTPNLPPLNPTQTIKLRHLTLLTLCATHTSSSLPYSYLQRSLSLPPDATTNSALESLATAAITAGLIHAKLSPRTSTLIVSSVAPLRDLPPNSVPELFSILGDWETRCTDVISDIEASIQRVRQDAEDRAKRKQERENRLDKAVKDPVATEANGDSAPTKDNAIRSGRMDWTDSASQGKKKRDYVSLDGGDDEDEGVEDMGDGGVKLTGDTRGNELVDSAGSGMDVDEQAPTEDKGKAKRSARMQKLGAAGMKRGRDS